MSDQTVAAEWDELHREAHRLQSEWMTCAGCKPTTPEFMCAHHSREVMGLLCKMAQQYDALKAAVDAETSAETEEG
jgi:hypothetical protein